MADRRPIVPNPPAGRVAAMRDVAAEAGVSTMTVSRVLHGVIGVAPETRARVLAAVDKLNYRRNEVARNLRLGRSEGLVGLVVTNLANPFYSQVAIGVEDVIGEHGLRLLVANTGEDVKREEDLIEDLAARRVHGMIVVPAGRTHRHLQALVAAHEPLVLTGRPAAGVEADCVLVDDYGGAFEATRRLLEQGHRRIAFLGNPPAVYTGAERFRGFSAALEEFGLSSEPRLVRRAQQTITDAEESASQLLALRSRPTAFFCANNRNTMGAVRAVVRGGRPVAIAGFDDFELADAVGLPLTIVSYNAADLGRWAAQLLMETAAQPQKRIAPRRVVVPTKVIEYGR
jgi:LacI family transcriptional regulator